MATEPGALRSQVEHYALLEMHVRWAATGANRPLLHLVFVEEPEAHLHTQLQQVFVQRILEIPALAVDSPFSRQFVITTHSPHILYQRGFTCIRYFRRMKGAVTSEILNLTKFFESSGASKQDLKKDFLHRYIKLSHCDLFFADAAIIVEGNVERLLLPLMLEKAAPALRSAHLSVLECNGAFAHRFKTLFEFLGIRALVITDLDSCSGAGNHPACPADEAGAITSNATLKTWLPKKTQVGELFSSSEDDCTSIPTSGTNAKVRVVFQRPVPVTWNDTKEDRVGRTLEEAFALQNLAWTQDKDRRDLGLSIENATTKSLADLASEIYSAVRDSDFDKTGFALAVIGAEDDSWHVPTYIANGLRWLEKEVTPAIEAGEEAAQASV